MVLSLKYLNFAHWIAVLLKQIIYGKIHPWDPRAAGFIPVFGINEDFTKRLSNTKGAILSYPLIDFS